VATPEIAGAGLLNDACCRTEDIRRNEAPRIVVMFPRHDPENSFLGAIPMTKHMPPVPPANRSNKGTGDSDTEPPQDESSKHHQRKNLAEQGETANIKQNTTNKGYFHGRRVK
jgi:hypothetical protein